MKGRRFLPLVVIAAGLLAYHNSFTGEFIRDDLGSIVLNPTIRHLWPIWQALSPPHRNWQTVEGRPFINLSLAINYALGGFNVRGYHALNLTIHILAGLTLLGIVRRTLLRPVLRERFGAAADELALASALLWMLHPLQTEAVSYIVQRAESIMGLFYLLTLYCFIRGVESPASGNGKWFMGNGSWQPRARLWYGISVAACALGMASKEVMVSAPVMVMLYDRVFVSGSFREAWRRRWPLYLALGCTWILLGCLLVSAGVFAYSSMTAQRIGITRWEYLTTEPGVILHYLRLCVWPRPLYFDFYEWPVARTWMGILPPAVVLLIPVAAAAWAWGRNPVPTPRVGPIWGFLCAWFFLILAPTSSVVPLHDVIFEHRMYLSLAAVVCLVVMGLYSLAGRRSFPVFVLLAIALGFLTCRRNRDYRSDIALRLDAVAQAPNAPLPRYGLGVALQQAGRFQEAIDQYERVVRLRPGLVEGHYFLGLCLDQVGRTHEAIEQYEQTLWLKPEQASALNSLGVALAKVGRLQEAVEHFQQSVYYKPGYAEARTNLGIALSRLGKLPEAMEQYREALRLKPDSAEAHYYLGLGLERLGRTQEAMGEYEQALRFKPDLVDAHNTLGIALSKAGRLPEAIEQFQQAVRLKPDFAEAHYYLGLALEGLERTQEATEQYEQAVHLKPNLVDAHTNLGAALAHAGRLPEAIEHFQQVVRLKPGKAEAHCNLGIALFQSGNVAEAIGQFNEALRINPNYAEAHNGAGSALLTMGRGPEAVRQYEEALRSDPRFAPAHYNLGVVLEQMGRWQDAMNHYEQALRIRPDYPEARDRLRRLRAAHQGQEAVSPR
ncbi:MAG TPA: tetratricopeptide repeat protein [Verrucomicrobiae bacterium]|nr:tetratricopeptide repeat protein [Verrucomicrobiae bacterium]